MRNDQTAPYSTVTVNFPATNTLGDNQTSSEKGLLRKCWIFQLSPGKKQSNLVVRNCNLSKFYFKFTTAISIMTLPVS